MKIYIAGPDVFKKNAVEIGKEYKQLCRIFGHKGLYPLDNEGDNSKDIYKGNLALIRECDAVIANGNPFRGEMDVGTAFEVGYAAARGKRVYIYMKDVSSLSEKYGKTTEDGIVYDENGMTVENFDSPLNLMLSESAIIVKGDFEDCLKLL